MGSSFTLKKNERITSRLLMDVLFNSKASKAVTAFPLRVVYAETERHDNDASVQVLFSVSKRHFKHAVDRNRVKRQLREAYRHNKTIIPEVADGRQLLIAFIWLTDRHHKSEKVTAAVIKGLTKIAASTLSTDETQQSL